MADQPNPSLLQIEPAGDRVRSVLTLGFPGGDVDGRTRRS
jgi:hypothetical protein